MKYQNKTNLYAKVKVRKYQSDKALNKIALNLAVINILRHFSWYCIVLYFIMNAKLQ